MNNAHDIGAAFSLRDRTALVTGGARGLGRGITGSLAALGARVVVNDLAPPDADAPLPPSMTFLQADVSDEAQVEAMFARADAELGGIDILVNNAGMSRAQTIDQISLADWDAVLRVNLTSAFLCSRAAFAGMKSRGRGGRIVNVSSVVAHQGALYGHVHYAASKSGLLGFTRTLARTAAPHGVTVNAVCPGVIRTELLERTLGEARIAELTAEIPLGLGAPADVGHAVAFLCSDAARYVTGACLDVNGGMHMR